MTHSSAIEISSIEDAPIMTDEIPAFTEIVRGPYTISSRGLVNSEQATILVKTLRIGSEIKSSGTLGGRSRAAVLEVPGLGKVFVKHYSHGGLLRSVTAGRFMAVGPARSLTEFKMLERVRGFGINAPRPIAIIMKGAIVYGTWLVMEEIPNTRSLVDIQKSEGELLHQAMEGLSAQMMLLVKNRVLHVDLHPGNVLLSPTGAVHIVDFDKAREFRGSAKTLCDLYLRRWRRAVIKHGLSPVLSEMMSLTLRSYSE